jgi:cyclophilin family peptidyl-prolyl cis-trans isomerase
LITRVLRMSLSSAILFSTALLTACQQSTATSPISVSSPIATPMQWISPPAMAIDPAVIYTATFLTAKGEFRVQLYADKTPVTVNNFVFLARQGFYNNTTFHRVIADFMAQGGDPGGTGAGGPGYTFADEIVPGLTFDRAGLLAMANSGENTNGSQFFITYAATPWLDGQHTIFGEVISGMDVVRSLTARDPEENPSFFGDRIISVTISEGTVSQIPTPMPTATPNPPRPQGNARPLATLEVTARINRYDARPALFIDLTHSYRAVLRTSKGRIVIELYAADAPQSVNNFVVLAQLGYWDGFPINFVDPGKYLLTGSPTGGSDSGVGYTLPPEAGRSNEAGAVGYWVREGTSESRKNRSTASTRSSARSSKAWMWRAP